MINSLEKLEIVKVRGEPRLRGEPHKSGRRIFAAAGGKKCSNYFQNRALEKEFMN